MIPLTGYNRPYAYITIIIQRTFVDILFWVSEYDKLSFVLKEIVIQYPQPFLLLNSATNCVIRY